MLKSKKAKSKKERKPLTVKQKKAIGFSLAGILVIGLVLAVIIVLTQQAADDEFSVKTGVASSTLEGEGQSLSVGADGVEITSGGIYNLSTNIDSGSVVVRASNADVKLILQNVSITNPNGPAIYVETVDNFYIELVGDSTISATVGSDFNGAIYSKEDIAISGNGSLTVNSNLDGIVGKDDLEIDSGTIIIKAEDDGIVGKDSIKIIDGTIEIQAGGDGLKTTNETENGDAEIAGGSIKIDAGSDGLQIMANLLISGGTLDITSGGGSGTSSTSSQWLGGNQSTSMKGIKANSSVQITGGTITIDSQDDSFHSDNNITIKGGSLTASSGDDGIHADNVLSISDGTVTISKAYEGIEAGAITIDGGDISVTAADDGFNAAGGSDTSTSRMGGRDAFVGDASKVLTINGGKIYVNSGGDGLDSNGNFYITGGTIYVDGPTNNGNGAVDYGDSGCELKITGGTLIAVGSSGMATNATSATQATVMINLPNNYSGKFSFGDISYTPAKSYSSILISSSKLSVGSSYDLKINVSTVQSVSLSNMITTSGNSGMQPGMGDGRQGGPGGRR